MEETVGNLDKDQLTRLAQYFDEKVTYPTKYKRLRVALPRQALRGPHAPIRTDESLRTTRQAESPKDTPKGAQRATSRRWWRSWAKVEPNARAPPPLASTNRRRGAWELSHRWGFCAVLVLQDRPVRRLCLERLSGNSKWAPFRGPISLGDGVKRRPLGRLGRPRSTRSDPANYFPDSL
jgi:hypothetical protein